MTVRKPFFAWPDRDILVRVARVGCALVVWFGIVYAGCDWITGQRSMRVEVHFAWETRIPFLPWMAVFYMALYPLFLAIPFVLRTRGELEAIAKALFLVIGIAGIGFLLLPVQPGFPPRPAGTGAGLFAFADWLNLEHNYAPSLHVTFAVLCVAVLARKAGSAGKAMLWFWAATVGISTLLTHQHHVLDVVTGVALGLVGAYGFYPRFIRPVCH